jgi:RNA recognition motif-containing protein
MNIYVGNLPYNITEDELKDVFAEHGAVDKVTLITDKYTGESKGFAFIEMPTQSEAEEAVKSLDGSSVKGRNIKVNQARPRTDRPQRRRSY